MKCHKTKRDGLGHIDAIGLRASAKKALRHCIREEAKLLLLFLVMRCYVSVFIRGIGLIFCFENNDV